MSIVYMYEKEGEKMMKAKDDEGGKYLTKEFSLMTNEQVPKEEEEEKEEGDDVPYT